MKLYHGTNIDFDKIDLMKSKPNKDFGRGFYLSDNYEQALEMAKTKVDQLGAGAPTILEYEIADEAFQNLHLLRFEEYSEEWAKFILLNRNNPAFEQAHDYDVVIGPIANDRVGLQLWKYENHSIDLPTFVKNLHYMRGVTIQYFFGTERSIQQLKRL
ncbi:MAG: DUF3990 domain-containing protein [Bacteroidaceae bacterium]|nr:DUF3990 domain-containing protein [Bacteroidaceae bacterium]